MSRTALLTAVLIAAAYLGALGETQPQGGWGATPVPPAVGTEQLFWGEVGLSGKCAVYRLAGGRLEWADHELLDGTFHVRTLNEVASITMPRGATALARVSELRGVVGELYFRPHCTERLDR